MAYREVTRVEINEVIRRWQLGMSQRQIAHGTGCPVQRCGATWRRPRSSVCQWTSPSRMRRRWLAWPR